MLAVYVFRACFQNDNNHSSIGLARFIHRGCWDSFFFSVYFFFFVPCVSCSHSSCLLCSGLFVFVLLKERSHVNWMCFVERPRNWRLMTWKAGSFIYLSFEEKVKIYNNKKHTPNKMKTIILHKTKRIREQVHIRYNVLIFVFNEFCTLCSEYIK